MKKILSLILIFVLICPAFSVYSAEQSSYDTAVEFLRVMEILPEDNLETEKITRADFAIYTAALANKNVFEQNDIRYYKDVPMDHYAAKAVNYLASINVLTENPEKRFRPDDIITVSEAAKMLVSLTGYDEYAKNNGGYPTGYINTAQANGILPKGVNSGELTTKDGVFMLYNALKAGYADITGVKGDFVVREEDGETLLSKYHDIYYDEGVVISVNGRSLYEDVSTDAGEIYINDTVYECDKLKFSDMLGSKVTYYYKKDSSGVEEVIFIEEEKNENITISIDSLYKFTKNRVEYHKNARLLHESLADNTVYVYNGQPLLEDIQAVLDKLSFGEITLKSREGRVFDVVIITDYENIYSKSVTEEQIHNYGGRALVIDDYDILEIYNADGEAIKLADIKTPGVVSIAKSKNNKIAKIIASDKTVKGTITALKTNDKYAFVTLSDGKELKAPLSYYEANKIKFNVSSTYKFYLDFSGNIVFSDVNAGEEATVGYLIKATVSEDDEVLRLKLMDNSGKMTSLDCSNRVVLDGVTYKDNPSEIIKNIPGSNGNSVAPQLIAYRLSDGKVTDIDTVALTAGESIENSLQKKTISLWDEGYITKGRAGYNVLLTEPVKIFKVPSDSEVLTASEYDFSVSDKTFTDAEILSNIEFYRLGEKSVYYPYIVHKNTDAPKVDNFIYLIKDKSKKIDSNGDVREVMTLMYLDREETFTVADNVDVSAYQKGDTVTIARNDSKITNIKMMYDLSKGGYPDNTVWQGGTVLDDDGNPVTDENGNPYHPWYYKGGNGLTYYGDYQCSFGYVLDKTDDILKWTYCKGSQRVDELWAKNITGSSSKLIIYDTESKQAYRGTIDDVRDYMSYGDECSRVLFSTRWNGFMTMIIYK